MFNGGFAFFELGSFSRFCVLTELQNFHEIKLPPLVGPESSRAVPPTIGSSVTLVMLAALNSKLSTINCLIIPSTLTGAEEKKTGPSRFNEDF